MKIQNIKCTLKIYSIKQNEDSKHKLTAQTKDLQHKTQTLLHTYLVPVPETTGWT